MSDQPPESADLSGQVLAPPAWRRLLPALAALALAAAVAAVYAYNVDRYWFLVDDAYISFRYSAHLADGLGLVWNPGERVEGYTNFLFVVLVALGMKLGLAPEPVAFTIGITSGAAVLLGLAAFAARRSSWTDPWIWAAPAVLATSRSFTAWSTGGLETMLFSAFAVGALLAFVVERERDRVPLVASLLLTLAALTRPEGGLYMGICGSFYLADELMRRGEPLHRRIGRVALFCAPFVAIVGAHFLWRYAYYGFWLPNTFYAKVNGAWWQQAARYFGLFHHDYGAGWYLPLAIVPLLARRGRTELLFVATLLLMTAYLTTVGGDIFEYRMLVALLPLGYWLVVDAGRVLATAVGPLRLPRTLLAAGAVASLILWPTHASRATEALPLRKGIASVQTMRAYTVQRLRQANRLAKLVEEGVLSKDIRIATSGAGALPYGSGLYTVDVLGLNDVEIAHRALEGKRGRPGHEKRAWKGYLAERNVSMLDVSGGFVYPGPAPSKHKLSTANSRLWHFNQTEGEGRLRLHCRRVPRGHLLFASNLSAEDFEATFGHLPECGRRAIEQLPRRPGAVAAEHPGLSPEPVDPEVRPGRARRGV